MSCPLRMSEEEESRAREGGRPPVIPFDFSDFARDDIIVNGDETEKVSKSSVVAVAPLPVLKKTSATLPSSSSDSSRPTGYANDDDDEDEDDMVSRRALESLPEETSASSSNSVVQFLRDVYIGSPYDSRRKQQARYVVRNVTGISLAIGVVFTLLWYLAPNKFISYRGDLDATQTYQTQKFVVPEDLLREDDENIRSRGGGGDYLDRETGVPDESIKRYPLAPPSLLQPNLPSFRAQQNI